MGRWVLGATLLAALWSRPTPPGRLALGYTEAQARRDFFYETRTFMPKDRPASLGERQYLDIVAYILQRNDYPAGPRELTAESTALSKIRIEPPR